MTAKTSDTKAAPKGPIAARDFRDADSGRSFAGGKPITDVEPGVLANYRAAGLLRPDNMNSAEQIVADGQDVG